MPSNRIDAVLLAEQSENFKAGSAMIDSAWANDKAVCPPYETMNLYVQGDATPHK